MLQVITKIITMVHNPSSYVYTLIPGLIPTLQEAFKMYCITKRSCISDRPENTVMNGSLVVGKLLRGSSSSPGAGGLAS